MKKVILSGLLLLLFSSSVYADYSADEVYRSPGQNQRFCDMPDTPQSCIRVGYQRWLNGNWITAHVTAFCSPGDYVYQAGETELGIDPNYYARPFFRCSYSEPVECEEPNYIDPDSNECVAPQEVCFTDLESMADECVFIGEPDPELPDGCVQFQGDQVCLTDDPNCYDVNGKQVCATPDSVCGFKNGAYECISPVAEGCGYFNGEMVCFTPDGEKVDQDSPDHPQNGGNLDGDDTNDPTDPRPPAEGGDPDNQPGFPEGGATEKTARQQLNELRGIGNSIDRGTKSIVDAIKGIPGGGGSVPGEPGETSDIVDGLTEESNQSELVPISDGIINTEIEGLEGYEEGIGVNPLDNDAADGVGDSVRGLIPQGSCSELGFNIKGHSFGLSCDKTQKIRDMLSWILYALTVWALFDIVTSPATRRS